MVTVEEAESFRKCNSCHSADTVYNITIWSNSSNQGSQISLCRKCILELAAKISYELFE